MKTKITTIVVAALAAISLCLAESGESSSKSDKMPAATLQEVHAELKKTQAELQQALARIAVLEQRVRSLEKANAKLEQEVQNFKKPHLIPLEHK